MKHGAGIYKVAKKLECKPQEILDFSSNINSYYIQIDVKLTHSELSRYGDSSYKELKKTIAKNYSLKKCQIALYNGASSAIFELFKQLKNRDVTLYTPLYGEYEKASQLTNKHITKIKRFKDIYKKPKKDSLVVFVNPSTPDGTFYEIKKLFSLWRAQNCTVIVDESFLEFESLPSCRGELESFKKLYILQSFTKFYACAGVRIGAIFSNKQNIKELTQPLWNLSTYDVKFLTKRLDDKAFKKEAKKAHKKNKQELMQILQNSPHFSKVIKSDANFILTKVKKSKKLTSLLLKRKILIRECGSFDTLSNEWLRFGVKEKRMHKKLKDALNLIS